MLTHTITLRDVYGVDTPEEVIAKFLTTEQAGKWEPTGEFRPPKELEPWAMSAVICVGYHAVEGPRLILRRRRVKRWRLAPGEQPRFPEEGEMVALSQGDVGESSYSRRVKHWILEQYEEEA